MSRTYSKGTCRKCGRSISMAGGHYHRHIETCKGAPKTQEEEK